jgi:hypothetical protein
VVDVELTDMFWLEATVFALVLTVYRIGIPETSIDCVAFVFVVRFVLPRISKVDFGGTTD